MPGPRPRRLFYEYSPSAQDVLFVESFADHLCALESTGLIESWGRRNLTGGEDSETQINFHLNHADIAVALVSSSLVASATCMQVVERALARQRAYGCPLVPILIRPVSWDLLPIAQLQPLPKDGRAISQWPTPDDGWVDVMRGLRDIVAAQQVVRSRSWADDSPTLLSEMGDVFDEDLRRAFALAQTAASSGRISTRDLFAAILAVQPQLAAPFPAGALPAPLTDTAEAELRPDPTLLSACVRDSLVQMELERPFSRKLGATDILVDIARHGTGASVQRLRHQGVGRPEVDQIVTRQNWSVINRAAE